VAIDAQWRREGAKGASTLGGTEEGRHLEGRKWNSEIWPLLEIAICIADSDILHPQQSCNISPVLGPHPNSTTPQKAVCTPRNLHC